MDNLRLHVRHRTLIMGFCHDLRDPNAKSTPVAAVFIGTVGARLLTGLCVFDPIPPIVDKLSRAVLEDKLPALLDRPAIERSIKTLDELHNWVRSLFRQTLHFMNELPVVEHAEPVSGYGDASSSIGNHFCTRSCPAAEPPGCECAFEFTTWEPKGFGDLT